jgi:hypothetical protein
MRDPDSAPRQEAFSRGRSAQDRQPHPARPIREESDMTTAAWVFFLCFATGCSGPEMRIVSGLTQKQCHALQSVFTGYGQGGTSIRAHCFAPDGLLDDYKP